MSVGSNSDILDRVEELAEQAGVQGERNLLRGEFVVLYELPSGRAQEVYVSDSTMDPEVPVISVRSTCVIFDKGVFKGVNKPMLLELLLTNEKLNFARYGLLEDEESYVVVASYGRFVSLPVSSRVWFSLFSTVLNRRVSPLLSSVWP
ncbi:MAG TPA: hypothetical protein EYO33_14775 [Phycisphaerales bacterium]|nr:hypothetical protein [Phycisphaerales bacterium]